MKHSAASVWFQPVRSSISTMMRRSISSITWKSEGWELPAPVRAPDSPGACGINSESCKRRPRTISLLRMFSGSRSASIFSCVESTTARSTAFSSSRTFPGQS